MNTCLECCKPIHDIAKYCSNKCQQAYQRKAYIERWLNGDEDGMSGRYDLSSIIRNYLFDKHNHSCISCGWGFTNIHTGKVPLEVHHIDGDWKNNSPDNLQLLCPNCHALTDNYGSKNSNSPITRKVGSRRY